MPHSWIIKYLELIVINNKVTSFTKKVMSYCRTRMQLHTQNNVTETEDVKNTMWNISRRFTVTAAILHLLNLSHWTTEYVEHRIRRAHNKDKNITPTLHDLKLIAKSEEQLQKRVQTVKIFSDDIHMEYGLEKCAKIAFIRDKLVHSQNLVIDINREMQELEQGKTYKDLRGWGKWRHTKSTNERKIEAGIQQELKNGTEMWTERQQ